MKGLLALAYAARYPANVAGLVLLAASAKTDFFPQAIEAGARKHGAERIREWVAAVSAPVRDDDGYRAEFYEGAHSCLAGAQRVFTAPLFRDIAHGTDAEAAAARFIRFRQDFDRDALATAPDDPSLVGGGRAVGN